MRILECSVSELDALNLDDAVVLAKLGDELAQIRHSLHRQRQALMPASFHMAQAQACDYYRVRFGMRRVVRSVMRLL